MDQPLEMPQAILAVQHQLSLLEKAGVEPALDRFAKHGVFVLHLVDELGEVLLLLFAYRVHKAVFKDGERFICPNRQEEVEGEVARSRIDVQGEIRPEIGIEAVHAYRKSRFFALDFLKRQEGCYEPIPDYPQTRLGHSLRP